MAIRFLAVGLLASLSWSACLAQVATDTADDPAYNSGWDLTDNGGAGFQPWNEVEALGGGRYLENSGRQVDGTRSFALYANTYQSSQYPGGYAVSRPLVTPLSQGSLSVLVRHDLDNATGFSGINLKSIAGPLFGGGELLAVGLVPTSIYSGGGNDNVSVFGSTSQSVSPNGGELRGDILDYIVDWNTDAGTYDVTIDDLTHGGSASTSGSLKAAGEPVVSIGFGNFDVGSFNNLIFDDLSVSAVPEPTTATAIVGLAGMCGLRRPRRPKGASAAVGV